MLSSESFAPRTPSPRSPRSTGTTWRSTSRSRSSAWRTRSPSSGRATPGTDRPKGPRHDEAGAVGRRLRRLGVEDRLLVVAALRALGGAVGLAGFGGFRLCRPGLACGRGRLRLALVTTGDLGHVGAVVVERRWGRGLRRLRNDPAVVLGALACRGVGYCFLLVGFGD